MRVIYAGKPLTGEGPAGVSGLVFNGSPVVQVEEFARASDITIFDRQRKQNRISFQITRQHATLNAAENYALTHADSLPNKGELIVVVENETGGAAAMLRFAQASVSAQLTHSGVSTVANYDVLCGKGVPA